MSETTGKLTQNSAGARPTLQLRLDLDGFEPDAPSLTVFAEHQLRRDKRLEQERALLLEQADAIERIWGCTDWSAALLSLLIQSPGAKFLDLGFDLEEPNGEREALVRLLAQSSRDRQADLTVHDGTQLTGLFRSWILALPQRMTNLRITFVDIGDSSLAYWPTLWTEAALEPLTRDPSLWFFLQLAALCGRNVPADLLLDFMALPDLERGRLIDRLDRELASEGNLPLFTDHEYRHPSFSGLLVYSFSEDQVRAWICEKTPAPMRKRLAEDLLSLCQRELRASSRCAKHLLAVLSHHCGHLEEYSLRRRELEWWIGPGETRELAEYLSEQIRTDQISAETVWQVLERNDETWPAYRRLALAQAYEAQPGGVPAHQRGEFHLLHAVLRRESQQLADAVSEARQAVAHYEEQSDSQAEGLSRAHTLLALLLREEGEPLVALSHWERALVLQEEQEGTAAQTQAFFTYQHAAQLLIDLGRLSEAKAYLERALKIGRSNWREGAPELGILYKSLFELLRKLGELPGARHYLELALAIDMEIHDGRHPQISLQYKLLADLLRDLGNLKLARRALERALAIEEENWGDDQPSIGIIHKTLADWAQQEGDFQAASDHLEAALVIEENQSAGGSPQVSVILRTLADIQQAMGHLESALRSRERAMAIDLRHCPPGHPQLEAGRRTLANLEQQLRMANRP